MYTDKQLWLITRLKAFVEALDEQFIICDRDDRGELYSASSLNVTAFIERFVREL